MPKFILLGLAEILLCITAHANTILTTDVFQGITVYYGTAKLYSPGGLLLSTTTGMTVETASETFALADQLYFMPLMAKSVAGQILADANVPLVFRNLSGFEGINGFGAPLPLVLPYVPPDPNNSPTASASQLTTLLTTQPAAFTITADTGFIEYGTTFQFAYFWGIFGPLPSSPPGIDYDIEGVTNVIFYQRDIQERETATPEPAGCAIFGLAVLAGIKAWRTTRRVYIRS